MAADWTASAGGCLWNRYALRTIREVEVPGRAVDIDDQVHLARGGSGRHEQPLVALGAGPLRQLEAGIEVLRLISGQNLQRDTEPGLLSSTVRSRTGSTRRTSMETRSRGRGIPASAARARYLRYSAEAPSRLSEV